MREPSFQYYPKDWRADGVSGCSLEARGLWHELMNLMSGTERYGYLVANGRSIPDEIIARYCGCPVEQYRSLLSELDSVGVPRRTSDGIIYSHRMVNDHRKRQEWRKQKQNQRDRAEECPQDVRSMSAPIASAFASASANKEKSKPLAAKPPKRGSQLPEGFSLSWEMHTFATNSGVQFPAKEFEAFCDYHRSKGSVFKDWQAAWRTWVRNSVKFGRANGKQSSKASITEQNLRNLGFTSEEVAGDVGDILRDVG